MELFELIKVILPAIITGMITFLITKYSYNNNRPLDKLEIAYNRVYYPLYKLVTDKNIKDIDFIITKANYSLNKYNKYVDRSTLRAFHYLCECNSEAKKKDAYENLKENIYNKNSYLRRRLGYLEPNFFQIYTYSSKAEKSTFRILLEIILIYIVTLVSDFFTDNIPSVLIYFVSVLLIIMLIEIGCKFVRFIYYTIKK